MSKKIVTERVDWFNEFEYFNGRSFDEVIDRLIEKRDFYAKKYDYALKVYLSAEYYDDDTDDLQVMIDRLETDKEMEKRLEKARKSKEKLKAARQLKKQRSDEAFLANEKQEKEVLKHLITKYGIPKE